MNVALILKRIKKDPLEALLREYTYPPRMLTTDDAAIYREGYFFWYLTAERLLKEMSIVRRWRNGPYYARKYRMSYSASERKLVARYRPIQHFPELDFCTFLIYSRILLDRIVRLSQRFLTGNELPSFSSFNRHKRFFLARAMRPFGQHEAYAKYIREKTNWFERLVKFPRDQYIVHTSPAIMGIFGLGFGPSEMKLVLIRQNPDSNTLNHLQVSALEVIHGISDLLNFFQKYMSREQRRRR